MNSLLIFAILIGVVVHNSNCTDDPFIVSCELDSRSQFLQVIIKFGCLPNEYNPHMFSNYTSVCCSSVCSDKSKIDIIQFENCEIPKFETNILTFYGNTYHFNMSNIGAESLQPEFFESGYRLTKIDASNNLLTEIPAGVFYNCSLIEDIDFSFNSIDKIDNWAFDNNKALTKLNLTRNKLLSLDPAVFAPLQLLDLDLSFNPLKELDADSFADIFGRLREFSMGGLQLEITVNIINALNPSLESLDISHNLLGRLNQTTFEKFNHLKRLNLSSTQLSNFGFGTFYHQQSLTSLDIADNHLGALNFTLFFRHFINLKLLNLEGNNLTEVDTMTSLVFPNIGILGLSKNNFSCDYLAIFLYRFPRVKLIYNPSGGPNIDGVDCYL